MDETPGYYCGRVIPGAFAWFYGYGWQVLSTIRVNLRESLKTEVFRDSL
jgi:hypothetical protein